MTSQPLARSGHEPHVVVLGSLNTDLVMRTERFPEPGETITAQSFQTFIGGKGLNQAIAAARQGARVSMIGRVGDDSFGETLRAIAGREGIMTERLLVTPGVTSGVANIIVDDKAENVILLSAGANGRVTPEDVSAASDLIASADVLLVQLEIPLDAVVAGAALARRHGVKMLLVPAPAKPLPNELLANVDVLVPNRVEISAVLAAPSHDVEVDARRALAIGARTVVVTLGSRGALVLDGPSGEAKALRVPAFPVKAIDTTGAGDAFAGGLAVALAAGEPLPQAVRRAAASGALACTVMGAEPSLPRREAVDALLAGGA